MFTFGFFSLSLVLLLRCLVSAQTQTACLNTLAYYNPTLRTGCNNATYFIISVPRTTAANLVRPYGLVTPPFSDRSLFPNGFPTDKHPVVVSTGFQNDIQMLNLEIDTLNGANIVVPYTDRLGDNQTPFNFPLRNYIGGPQKSVQAVIPAIVGTAEGTNIFVGDFAPSDNAYAVLGPNPTEFVAQVRQLIVDNPVSGPSVNPQVFNLKFIPTSSPLYTTKTFHSLVNQPSILTNGFCQRNTLYFNQTFTDSRLRSGNVTLYPPLAGAAPAALGGIYVNQGGYSAAAVSVGFDVSDCATAARNVDPASLQ